MMIYVQRFLIFILLLLTSTACVSAATITDRETAVPATTAPLPEAAKPLMIRVYNNSGRVFDSVEVQFPEQTEQYGVVGAGSSSEYRVVSQAYQYAYVHVMVGGEAFTLQPIDYVGESLLAPGEYTYVLDIVEGQLFLTLAEGEEIVEEASSGVPVVEVTVETAVSATDTAPADSPPVDLNGTQWDIIAYGATDKPASMVAETQPTAEFLDGQVSGTTGCNQYFAPFSQSGDTLTTGPVASTRRACTEPVGLQEAEILQGWDTAVSYELNGDTLIIHHESGVLILVAATAVKPEGSETTTTDAVAAVATEPPEAITILSPATGSRVTSPITISGESDYAFEGELVVEIATMNGEVVGNGFARLNVSDIGLRGPFLGEAAFTGPEAPTPARIAVYMVSPRDGHIEHLASTNVTLLPQGETAEIITAVAQPEAIAVHSPERLADISGGTVFVTGFAAPTFEQNLVIEILGEDGQVVGNGFTTIASDIGEWGDFAADVTYTVTAETHGAVCVQDVSAADGGLVHRNCVAVTLMP